MRYYKIEVESYWRHKIIFLVIDRTDTDARLQLYHYLKRRGKRLTRNKNLRGWYITKITRIYPGKSPLVMAKGFM
jgi:hypothetical protein